MEYTTGSESLLRVNMTQNTNQDDDGNPKFGRLLLVLGAAVVFCGVLTWVMGAFFPNFPNF
jgi:hypothetical protein